MNEKLISKCVEWSEEAASVLQKAANHCDILDLKNQVDNGATLWRLAKGKELVGYYILRVEKLATCFEGVLVAAAGNHPDIDLTQVMVPLIERQFKGCDYLRIHTARAGLIKKLTSIGFAPQEFVMRKRLNVQ